MSSSTNVVRTSGNPNSAAAAASPYGAFGAPSSTEQSVSGTVAEERQKLNNYLSGEWSSPWYMLLIEVVIALIFILVIYYVEYQAFDSTGVIGASNPGTFGNYHGVWLYLGAFLAIFGAATTIGLMYAKTTDSIMWMFITSIILVLLFLLRNSVTHRPR